ncbi:class I SAM-dependent methyltransferase [Methanocella sp. CWC-04]|uniref:Class I SAM-dependent methyltransferase n=1 Tax=Methanooceanicella nereidis TaxID=2052831 RepID=A0AAP2W5N6_9EURY|nr:class I SAM-dependent methyltransferase [Methanocella sp. CWC-04]MCD1294282.1 class I SAM-dependent methyltransferase [Methanocella sp. CWC-04]
MNRYDKKKSKEFDMIAKTAFAPIYPVIAQQIVDRCGVRTGICIDAGSGPALLAIALTKMTALKTYSMDSSEDMREIAAENIGAEGLSDRIVTIRGDVQDMPFEDGFANLVVSRGSFFFWDDLVAAFKEIYRVLSLGGRAYIGGGFGNAELRARAAEEMRKVDEKWEDGVKKRFEMCNAGRFHGIMRDAYIPDYEIIDDETGFWILFKKA